jgi:hypothetical protein
MVVSSPMHVASAPEWAGVVLSHSAGVDLLFLPRPPRPYFPEINANWTNVGYTVGRLTTLF